MQHDIVPAKITIPGNNFLKRKKSFQISTSVFKTSLGTNSLSLCYQSPKYICLLNSLTTVLIAEAKNIQISSAIQSPYLNGFSGRGLSMCQYKCIDVCFLTIPKIIIVESWINANQCKMECSQRSHRMLVLV